SFIMNGTGYFLEGAAKGELMSAEGFTNRGEYHFFGLCGRMLIKADPTVEVGSTFPVHHPRLDEIKELTKNIHEELGYYHGPSHVEFMIPEDGPIEMVEFNPRLAGVTNLTLFNLVMGEPTEDALVELGCGRPMPTLDSYSTKRAGTMCNVFSPVIGGTLDTLDTPDAEWLRVFKSMGDPLATKVSEFDYFACVMETGGTMTEAVEKIEAARRGIIVNGVSVGDNSINDVITNGVYD
ncbi:MAG: ATP-grasp domain-containing protein, partial [Pseudomonadota bacterium]